MPRCEAEDIECLEERLVRGLEVLIEGLIGDSGSRGDRWNAERSVALFSNDDCCGAYQAFTLSQRVTSFEAVRSFIPYWLIDCRPSSFTWPSRAFSPPCSICSPIEPIW